jgi:hypothetical protein
MKDKTPPFVKEVHDYAVSNSTFVPAYLNVPELKIDLEAVEAMTQVYRQTEQLYKALDDTILLSGSEAYSAYLLYYTSVKAVAASNILNAKPIYEDLKQQFPGRSKTPAVKEI